MTDNAGSHRANAVVTEAGAASTVSPSAALTTYRYLRLGLIAAVVMLAMSVLSGKPYPDVEPTRTRHRR